MTRVTHRHIAKAVAALNAKRGKSYPEIGYLSYADVGGWGVYSPSFYAIMNASGGVTNVASNYRGKTLRETLANVEKAMEEGE